MVWKRNLCCIPLKPHISAICQSLHYSANITGYQTNTQIRSFLHYRRGFLSKIVKVSEKRMIFRQKAMLRTAIRPKRKVVAGRTLGNGVARRGYCGVPVDDFRASFPLSGMTLSVVLGRTPWRAMRESYTDCREYMPLPPFVNPRPAEDVPEAAGGPMQPSASGGCGLPLFGRGRKRIFFNRIWL